MNRDKKGNQVAHSTDQANDGSEKLNSLLQASLLHDAVLKKMLTHLPVEPKASKVLKGKKNN